MKKLIFILLFFPVQLLATNYYVKNGGNDAAAGTSDALAWETISKVNTVWNAGTFAPGDTIFFKRGSNFTGTLTVKESGTSGSPIVVSAYGTGLKPILSGFQTLTSWTNEGGGIYSKSISPASDPNILLSNGVNTPKGRWPDALYMTIDGSTSTSITDAALPASPDYDGGEVVIRTRAWVIERRTVTHNEHTLTYSATSYTPYKDDGYFIQNHLSTLTTESEWCYTGGKIYYYFGSETPTSYTVKTSIQDRNVTVINYDYIVFDNLTLEGANVAACYIESGDYIEINNCKIENCGQYGIYGSAPQYLTVYNDSIMECNDMAMRLSDASTHLTFRDNYVYNIGMIVGMGNSSDQSYSGVYAKGNYGLFTYNQIINCGYDVIVYGGTDTEVSYNFIDTHCTVKDDGGGIYSYRDFNTGKVVKYNIIINGQGNNQGYHYSEPDRAHGIYNDGSRSTTYTYNTCYNNNGAGILVNACKYITGTFNTFYDNYTQLWIISEMNDYPTYYAEGHDLNNNICFARITSTNDWEQSTLNVVLIGSTDFTDYGSTDYNYYVRPIDNDNYIDTWYSAWLWDGPYRTAYNLTEWQALSGKDAHSASTPVTITSDSELHFAYNNTTATKYYNLSADMVDGRGVSYSAGIIGIPSFRSVVLIGTGTLTETEEPEEEEPPTGQGKIVKHGGKIVMYNGEIVKY